MQQLVTFHYVLNDFHAKRNMFAGMVVCVSGRCGSIREVIGLQMSENYVSWHGSVYEWKVW